MPKEKFFDPRKPFQSQRPETHEEWQARMGGEVLAVVRSGLYLDFRFLDMALSALNPAPDERCRVLATDGQTLYYQPQRLLQLYQENPKYLNRLYLHTIFHCVFRHLWLKGRREPQLWSLACDIAVENVIDSLQRKSVTRPLTYVRQNAYRQITAEEKVVAAAPVYRWLTRQTPGVLRQLEREFVTDDHRLWPKDAPEQPQQMPTPLPQKTWQKIGERMQTELEGKASISNIKDYAEQHLGLQKLDQSQIQYIDIQTEDTVEIDGEEQNIFVRLKHKFEDIVAYLRG